jgi:hypothetical protein
VETSEAKQMVTVDELEAMTSSIAEKRQEVAELSRQKTAKQDELDLMEERMMLLLEQSGKHDYHGEAGTFYISSRETVKVPKDLDSKRELFDYLRAKGIFEELVSVNSQTLNAFYKAEKKAAEENGNWGFTLPGVGEPTVDQIPAFRAKK